MIFYLTALALGLCLSAMGLGIFITMKIFRIPDITTDGSYTLGGVVTAILLLREWPMPAVIAAAMAAGSVAGVLTGLVHTRLKIDALLSGILVMTGLYSINLNLLGRSNVPLNQENVIFSTLGPFEDDILNEFSVSLLIVVVLSALLAYVLRTDFGLAMRATGSSETMTRALGINNNRMKIIGLAIANAMTALTGSLVAQYQRFTDINMGIGIVLVGLGSVLIGDALIQWLGLRRVWLQLLVIVAGCILFQIVLATSLTLGVDPSMIKLITSLAVMAIVGIPRLVRRQAI
ncbi:MAG: ABC transporter permease [Saprospiraceae bacterium]|nr:ABC transporter permease [Saprospiraceae bacterium]MCB0574495.1 ABC transporter permease [Saprospiraceae bacterium]MCB9308293.1 ABC transporter permease [Lewinellaceae bacterium]MCB9353534.1 ABC transporter permease [Lewinellaceae bacterium]